MRIEVLDNGPGVPEAVRATIFDPFVTSKPPGEGVGLGLTISSASSAISVARFACCRPNAGRISRWSCALRPRIEPETPMPSTIVLIDDDEEVLEALAETFRLGVMRSNPAPR